MRGYNHVVLIGNCGKDPEIKQLEDGTNVAKITLATTSSYRNNNGEMQNSTDWHTVIIWRKLADLAGKYVVKGSLIMIEGQLKHRSYVAKEGHTVHVTEVVANNLIMLDKRPPTEEHGNDTNDISPF